MKKIVLDVETLKVQSFEAGTRPGGTGTVKAHSGDQVVSPSDWNPLDCAPSGFDTGSMCGCGGSHSGYAESCYEASCIHGVC